jgi:hypothetical protein
VHNEIEGHMFRVRQFYLAKSRKPRLFERFFKDVENSGFRIKGVHFPSTARNERNFIKEMDDYLKKQNK